MNRSELARALGVTPGMVTRYAQRGMPVDTVERAQRWRRRHLEPSRMKEHRFNPSAPNSPPPAPVAQITTVPNVGPSLSDTVASYSYSVELVALGVAVAIIERHPAHAAHIEHLRELLRGLPDGQPPRFPLCVWVALTDYMLAGTSPARYSTDERELLDPDEYSERVGTAVNLGGHQWLEVARDWHGYALNGCPDDDDDDDGESEAG